MWHYTMLSKYGNCTRLFKIKNELRIRKNSSLRSKRFRARSSRKLGREQKKKKWRGRGKGKKETLARKPHDFEKLRSPTNAASDWCGAGSLDYLSLETSIKLGIALFTCVTDLVSSDSWSLITNALDWYLFESCLCESLWGQSPFKV